MREPWKEEKQGAKRNEYLSQQDQLNKKRNGIRFVRPFVNCHSCRPSLASRSFVHIELLLTALLEKGLCVPSS